MKKTLLLLLIASFLFSIIAFCYDDVANGDWYEEAVSYVTEHKLMPPRTAANFRPNSPATRGELVAGLYALAGSPAVEMSAFPDVAADAAYASAAAWAAENGISLGYEDGRFGGEDTLTREQLAVMLRRFTEAEGLSFPLMHQLLIFLDEAEISPWAKDAVEWTVRAGILRGDGKNFRPQNKVLRAETAVFLMRLHRHMETAAPAPTESGKGELTVSFHYNADLRGICHTAYVKHGDTVAPPADPVRQGYRFAGWFTAEKGGERFDFTAAITESLTLYARWDQQAVLTPVRPPATEK